MQKGRSIMEEKIDRLGRKLYLLPIYISIVNDHIKAKFYLRLLSDSGHLSTLCTLFAKPEIFSS